MNRGGRGIINRPNGVNNLYNSRSELFVDDPGREGKIDVSVNVSFPALPCECESSLLLTPLLLPRRLGSLNRIAKYSKVSRKIAHVEQVTEN